MHSYEKMVTRVNAVLLLLLIVVSSVHAQEKPAVAMPSLPPPPRCTGMTCDSCVEEPGCGWQVGRCGVGCNIMDVGCTIGDPTMCAKPAKVCAREMNCDGCASAGCIWQKNTCSPECAFGPMGAFIAPCYGKGAMKCMMPMQQWGFLVKAPQYLRAGYPAAASFSVERRMKPARLMLTVTAPDGQILVRRLKTVRPGMGHEQGTIVFTLPSDTAAGAGYTIGIRGDAAGTKPFMASAKVRVRADLNGVFVQTDKPLYKPGDTVRMRVLVLDQALQAVSDTVTVEVTSAAGQVLARYVDQPLTHGMASLSMPLSTQPVLGEWVIRAVTAKSNAHAETSVEVDEYVLPKFGVTVHAPTAIVGSARSYYINSGSSTTTTSPSPRVIGGRVDAKYTYGLDVRGSLLIELYQSSRPTFYWQGGRGGGGRMMMMGQEDESESELETERLLASQLVADFNGTYAYELPLSGVSYGQRLRVRAILTEEGTGIEAEGEADIGTNWSPIEMQWRTRASTSAIKAGLPFSMDILAKNADGSPADTLPLATGAAGNGNSDEGIPLQPVCVVRANGKVVARKTLTFIGGHSELSLPADFLPEDLTEPGVLNNVYFALEMPKDDGKKIGSDKSAVTATVSLGGSVHSPSLAYSPSGSFLALSIPQTLSTGGFGGKKAPVTLRVGDTVRIEIQHVDSANPNPAVQVDVLARGTIALSKMTLAASDSVVRVRITAAMAPNFCVVAQYIRSDGEVVADRLELQVEAALDHTVSVGFGAQIVRPGDPVDLKVSAASSSSSSSSSSTTAGNSTTLVAVTAVDRSVSLLRARSAYSAATAFARLDEIIVGDKMGTDTALKGDGKDNGMMMGGGGGDMMWGGGGGGGGNKIAARDIFRSAGMAIMTSFSVPDSMPDSMEDGRPVPMMEADFAQRSATADSDGAAGAAGGAGGDSGSAVKVRKNFPETWLFDLYEVPDGTEVTIPLVAPDTITAWNLDAFAVSDAAGLAVAAPGELTVFQPFFVTAALPYSVIRGEATEIRTAVFNYAQQIDMTKNATVIITLVDSSHYEILGAASATVSVAAGAAAGHSFFVRATKLGHVPIRVTAMAGGEGSGGAHADAAERTLLVKPEGVPREYSQSVFVEMAEGVSSAEFELDVAFSDDDELVTAGGGAGGDDESAAASAYIVPGSVRVTLQATTDLMGPSIDGLDRLVRMPTGCGEQNLITLGPVVSVTSYLEETGGMTSELRDRAYNFMRIGYQRQLTYRRSDAGYSAFGEQDAASSLWLTAFTLRTLSAASRFVAVDAGVQRESAAFIAKRFDTETGHFLEMENARVIHQDMLGGVAGGKFALTAYVTAALLEAGFEPQAAASALATIEAGVSKHSDQVYASVIAAYVLTLAKSELAEAAVTAMEVHARRQNNMVHWSRKSVSSGNQGQEEEEKEKQEKEEEEEEEPVAMAARRRPFLHSQEQPAADVEMTAYALMVYTRRGNAGAALEAARWLLENRNALGGYRSTQDTVVALQALSEFSARFGTAGGDMTVTLTAAASGEAVTSFTLNAANHGVLQRAEAPARAGVLKGTVTKAIASTAGSSGAAAAAAVASSCLVQVLVRWYETDQLSSITGGGGNGGGAPLVSVDGSYEANQDGAEVVHEVCARTPMGMAPRGMSIIRQEVFTGFVADATELDTLLNTRPDLKRVEKDGNDVFFYVDALSAEPTCFRFRSRRNFAVAGLTPAAFEAYDYYEPAAGARGSVVAGPNILLDEEALARGVVTVGTKTNVGVGHQPDDRDCKRGHVVVGDEQQEDGEKIPCSCTDNLHCFICGEKRPGVCRRCRNKRVLVNGACVEPPPDDGDDGATTTPCPATGDWAYLGSGTYGRECRRAPFTCSPDGRNSVSGEPCSCDKLVTGCTTCQVGVGRNNVTCTACASDRYLLSSGRCALQASCRGGKVSNSLVPEKCSCKSVGGNGCHVCDIKRRHEMSEPESMSESRAIACTGCRSGRYFHRGECVTTCPPHLARVHKGASRYGRHCAPSPVTCKGRKITSPGDWATTGRACRCAKSAVKCGICAFTSASSIEPGSLCVRCNKGYHLHDSRCVEICPTGLAHVGVSKYGRTCALPFVCRYGRNSKTGVNCVCPKACKTSCKFNAGNKPGMGGQC